MMIVSRNPLRPSIRRGQSACQSSPRLVGSARHFTTRSSLSLLIPSRPSSPRRRFVDGTSCDKFPLRRFTAASPGVRTCVRPIPHNAGGEVGGRITELPRLRNSDYNVITVFLPRVWGLRGHILTARVTLCHLLRFPHGVPQGTRLPDNRSAAAGGALMRV
jgi:hypothetical protein